tara:strand:+ start:329 stop:529 length:201 start_codon:yes stop_codon:yes gene_type:complete
MSAQPKYEEENKFPQEEKMGYQSKKVNLNDLVARMKEQKKQDQKSNLILSAAAISAVTVFGIILTL